MKNQVVPIGAKFTLWLNVAWGVLTLGIVVGHLVNHQIAVIGHVLVALTWVTTRIFLTASQSYELLSMIRAVEKATKDKTE